MCVCVELYVCVCVCVRYFLAFVYICVLGSMYLYACVCALMHVCVSEGIYIPLCMCVYRSGDSLECGAHLPPSLRQGLVLLATAHAAALQASTSIEGCWSLPSLSAQECWDGRCASQSQLDVVLGT